MKALERQSDLKAIFVNSAVKFTIMEHKTNDHVNYTILQKNTILAERIRSSLNKDDQRSSIIDGMLTIDRE